MYCPRCAARVKSGQSACKKCGLEFYPGHNNHTQQIRSRGERHSSRTRIAIAGTVLVVCCLFVVGIIISPIGLGLIRIDKKIIAEIPEDQGSAASDVISESQIEDPALGKEDELDPEPIVPEIIHSGLEMAIDQLSELYEDADNLERISFKPGNATATDKLSAVITYMEPYSRDDFPDLVESFVDKVMATANENEVLVFYVEVGLKQDGKMSIYWQCRNRAEDNNGLKIGDIEDKDVDTRIRDIEYNAIPSIMLIEQPPASQSSPSSPSTPEPSAAPEPNSPSGSSYQSILDNYSAKIRAATPRLIAEYNSEAASISGDIEALAALVNSKIYDLAEISNEGIGKMAEVMLATGGGYDTYEEWAGKLMDVYNEEAGKIMDAYMASAQG